MEEDPTLRISYIGGGLGGGTCKMGLIEGSDGSMLRRNRRYYGKLHNDYRS